MYTLFTNTSWTDENFAMRVTWSVFVSLCDLLTSHLTVSIQSPPLVSCLHQVPSGPIVCLTPNYVLSSPAARLPPPPYQFEPNRLSPASTMSFQAQPLMSYPHHINPSATAHVPPLPCQFKPDCSSPSPTALIQAIRSSPTSTISI